MKSNTKLSFGIKILEYQFSSKYHQKDLDIKTTYRKFFVKKTQTESFSHCRIIGKGKMWGHWSRLFFPKYYITIKFQSEFHEKTTEANFNITPHALRDELTLMFLKEKDMKIALERIKHLLKLD